MDTVYVLFHETNTGKYDDSDGYIEAVYATRALAEKAYLAAVREAIDDGKDVYFDPDTKEENTDWDHDWRVEEWSVRTAAPKLPRKRRGIRPRPTQEEATV